MKNKKQGILIITVFCCSISFALGQTVPSARKKNIVLSAIQGQAGKPDTVTLAGQPAIQGIRWVGGDSVLFSMQLLAGVKGSNERIVLRFQPAMGFTGIARAALQVATAGGSRMVINCTGLSTKGLEGENEAPLSVIANALGYTVNIGWPGLANNTRPKLQGEESAFSLFHKAGKGEVEMIPVARYSPDFELPFGYYTNSANGPVKHPAGILAKAGSYPEHQTLFPAIASGSRFFDPGNSNFGFYATGPSHNAYSEDVWNMIFHPENAVRAVRIYPVKKHAGSVLKNTWLVCFEEAKNGDYNDYVFLVKNVIPVNKNTFKKIFNGTNLQGWHTFIKGRGNNIDPTGNFQMEDNALHVRGQELGYVITDSPYHNFHFKIEFRWGEKKWPPRENAKRDAGICYNIPVNEPDSIWPVSIECQVQEGDVGDFWLLGFSTIAVNGQVNNPSAHTQVVKKRDGEKPAGQWNSVEVISYNGTCVHIVNGVLVNHGSNASVKDGRILLQSEYAEVFYRNVYLRKL